MTVGLSHTGITLVCNEMLRIGSQGGAVLLISFLEQRSTEGGVYAVSLASTVSLPSIVLGVDLRKSDTSLLMSSDLSLTIDFAKVDNTGDSLMRSASRRPNL